MGPRVEPACDRRINYCSKRGCVTAGGTDGSEAGKALPSGGASGAVASIVADGGAAGGASVTVLAVVCTSGGGGSALSTRLGRLRAFGAPILAASATVLSKPSPEDK